MRSTAVVISASVWQEPLSGVVIEALANGRPVLGTAMGGTPYLIGPAGWTVEPTADTLAAALPTARAGAAALAPVARARYEEMFTPATVLEQLVKIYADTAALGVRR